MINAARTEVRVPATLADSSIHIDDDLAAAAHFRALTLAVAVDSTSNAVKRRR
jgi:hypothetical protein